MVPLYVKQCKCVVCRRFRRNFLPLLQGRAFKVEADVSSETEIPEGPTHEHNNTKRLKSLFHFSVKLGSIDVF
jgi:hypothetical protein